MVLATHLRITKYLASLRIQSSGSELARSLGSYKKNKKSRENYTLKTKAYIWTNLGEIAEFLSVQKNSQNLFVGFPAAKFSHYSDKCNVFEVLENIFFLPKYIIPVG